MILSGVEREKGGQKMKYIQLAVVLLCCIGPALYADGSTTNLIVKISEFDCTSLPELAEIRLGSTNDIVSEFRNSGVNEKVLIEYKKVVPVSYDSDFIKINDMSFEIESEVAPTEYGDINVRFKHSRGKYDIIEYFGYVNIESSGIMMQKVAIKKQVHTENIIGVYVYIVFIECNVKINQRININPMFRDSYGEVEDSVSKSNAVVVNGNKSENQISTKDYQ
ncbi:MAG: hypothetical protein JXR23_10360 [Pontiellaceae bacterium]|nr:hypothetical protein [Pontiellaceae bacterium]